MPLVELTDPISGVQERYCDGGIVSNSPALIGYAEAVSHLGRPASEIEILSLGTPRANIAEPLSSLGAMQRRLSRGLLGWGLGERIISLTIDGGAMVTDTALLRIARAAGARYHRVTLSQPDGVGLDVTSSEATQTLKHLGVERARVADTQRALAPFFLNADQEAV